MGLVAMTPKVRDAIAIRDAALEKLRKVGRRVARKPITGTTLEWSDGSLLILHRTPFQRLPPVPDQLKHEIARFEGGMNLGYGLDIWDQGNRKVLNVEWNDDGALKLVSFRRGPWEAKLLALREPMLDS